MLSVLPEVVKSDMLPMPNIQTISFFIEGVTELIPSLPHFYVDMPPIKFPTFLSHYLVGIWMRLQDDCTKNDVLERHLMLFFKTNLD